MDFQKHFPTFSRIAEKVLRRDKTSEQLKELLGVDMSNMTERDAKMFAAALPKMVEGVKSRQFIEFLNGVPITRLRDFGSYLDASTSKVWASFKACDIVGKAMLTAVLRPVSDNDRRVPEKDAELMRVLSSPNPFDTMEDAIYQWAHHMMLTGNAYWLKDEMDGRGRPKNIFPLLPQYIEIIPDAKERVSHYLYKINGQEIKVAREEMIHFRRPNPNDVLLGVGDVAPASALFQEFITRARLEEKFLTNGAQPSGVLHKKEATNNPEEWKRFVSEFRQRHEGVQNAGKTVMLNGDWAYIKMGLSSAEAQALEKSKLNRDEIFMAHGVPLSVAGVEGASNYATSKQDEINFRKYTVVPWLDIFTTKLSGWTVGKDNRKQGTLMRAFDESFRLTYEMSGLVDIEQVMKDYGPLFQRAAITPNELRELAGLEKVDDPMMDQFFISQGMLPVSIAGFGTGGIDMEEL